MMVALVIGTAVTFVGLLLLGMMPIWKRPGLGLVPLCLLILGLFAVKYGVKWAEQRRQRIKARDRASEN
jgi:hypothetical protein